MNDNNVYITIHAKSLTVLSMSGFTQKATPGEMALAQRK